MKIQNMTIIKEKSKSTPTVSIYCLQIFSRYLHFLENKTPTKTLQIPNSFPRCYLAAQGETLTVLLKKKGKKSKDIINKVSLGSSKGS